MRSMKLMKTVKSLLPYLVLVVIAYVAYTIYVDSSASEGFTVPDYNAILHSANLTLQSAQATYDGLTKPTIPGNPNSTPEKLAKAAWDSAKNISDKTGSTQAQKTATNSAKKAYDDLHGTSTTKGSIQKARDALDKANKDRGKAQHDVNKMNDDSLESRMPSPTTSAVYIATMSKYHNKVTGKNSAAYYLSHAPNGGAHAAPATKSKALYDYFMALADSTPIEADNPQQGEPCYNKPGKCHSKAFFLKLAKEHVTFNDASDNYVPPYK